MKKKKAEGSGYYLAQMTIKQHRMAREMSQQEVAEMLHIHPVTYGYKEAHPEKFRLSELFAIFKIFGIEYDDIFFNENP